MTSSVASVPPVEAPRPMTTLFRAGLFPRSPAGAEEAVAATAPAAAAEAAETAWGRETRTRDMEATSTFWARAVIKEAWVSSVEGLRTKSTAPAARASNTFRFKEETRMTGMGWVGRYSLRNSMPFCPGISTSMVITSGFKAGIFCLASRVLMANPTTSILGWAERPLVIMLRASSESSTTITRIFLPGTIFGEYLLAKTPAVIFERPPWPASGRVRRRPDFQNS